MGRTITSLVAADPDLQLVCGCEVPGSATIGRDCGELAGVGALEAEVTDDLEAMVRQSDVVIDFSHPDTTEKLAGLSADHQAGLVIGTTGLSAAQQQSVRSAAERIPVLMSPNMSVGVNVTFKLVELATKALGQDVDIEIFEMHHSHKNDAPSGTAVRLGEVAAAARETTLQEQAIYGREGFTGERKPGNIGFHSARGGDIVGDHSVIYAGTGERIEITHRSQSRVNFGAGAIRAAHYIADKHKRGEAGFFDMPTILGLS